MNNNQGRRRVRRAQKKSSMNRILLMICMVAMVAAVSIGGTLAWLTDYTSEVKNTFTPSNIDIDLDESDDLDLQMVPGSTITKDPVITVNTDSEDLWLYVELTKSENFDDFMEYTMAAGWESLQGVDNVFYRKVLKTELATDNTFDVIKDNTVTVKGTVTKEMMDPLYADSTLYPTLTVKAYAVQYENLTDAKAAWDAMKTQETNGYDYVDPNGIEFAVAAGA